MGAMRVAEHVETVVIGGGQAGLSVGYHLARRGLSFVILDAHERTGDSWRRRWDSLRLFTINRYAGLEGMRLPGARYAFATKDEIADYLEEYAAHFELPIRRGVRVDRVSRNDRGFVVDAGDLRFEATNVVNAMAGLQKPREPSFASDLDSGIVQMHSFDYRNASQLQDGGVLVAGAGNSAADIAMEVAATHPTWMAGKESGHIPPRIETVLSRYVVLRLVRFVGHHVLTLDTRLGRKLRPVLTSKAAPLIRVKPKDLIAAGVERVPRVVGVREGLPVLEDDRVLEVANVIWCTGFHHGFSWIDLPVFGEDGEPMHHRGVVDTEPGFYFVGLDFQYAMSSETLIGVSRDAAYVVDAIAMRPRVVDFAADEARAAV